MSTTIFTLTLISLVLCVGVAVALLELHLESTHRRETRLRRLIEERDAMILEQETTIEAYREVVAFEMSGVARVPMPAEF
jgi:hypothetical protein